MIGRLVACATAMAIGIGAFAVGPIDVGSFRADIVPAALAAGNDRDAYVKEHEGRFEEWGRKVDKFSERTQEKGKETAGAAERNLEKAWAEVLRNWRALKQGSKDSWQEAKEAFENSWERFEKAWAEAQESG